MTLSILKRELAALPVDINQLIESRLGQFSSFKDKKDQDWFSELCFCLLTANAKASTALTVQEKLGYTGFVSLPQKSLAQQLKVMKHRFHNNKSKYIEQARRHTDVRQIIQEIVTQEGESAAREWLVTNIKGLGYKESSHFLRNTGHSSLAILDRHIINLLVEHNFISPPANLSKKSYLEIEKVFQDIATKLNTTPAKLDLQLWYVQTGKVLK